MAKPKYTPETNLAAYLSRVDKSDGDSSCWLWTASTTDGYGRMLWHGKQTLAHRIAYEIAHGEPPPRDLLVMHSCDVRRCCNPAHLSLGTLADNAHDRDNKGRSKKGHPQSSHKLSKEQVEEIRLRYRTEKTSTAKLGVEYGVSPSWIYLIITYQLVYA